MSSVQFQVSTPVQAHEVLTGLWKGVIQPHTKTGAAGILTWQTESEYLRERHRAAFHGPILQAFADQLWLFDPALGRLRPYSKATWKRFLKEEFLEPQIQEYIVRKTGEVKYRQLPLSTERLSNDEYRDFLHQVTALGIEHGVDFNEESY